MDRKLPDELLADLNEYISSFMGLYFTESRFADLERAIALAAKDFGYEDEAAFISWLKSRPLKKEQIERLAAHLTVGETYFFRDPDSFEALEHRVFPELLRSRHEQKRIRVWSAGCSTGEEAYSIAMLLSRLVTENDGWNISILATDINAVSLKKASDGVYTQWSFRNTPEWIRNKYFTRTEEGAYRIDPEIRKMVSFGYLNLAEDIYPSLLNGTNGVDIILCRNVIMYLSDAVAGSVVRGFNKALVDDGWLLVSPAEALRVLPGVFAPVNLGEAIFYRKALSALDPPEREFAPLPIAFNEPPAEKEAGPLLPVEEAPESRVPAPLIAAGQLAGADGLYGQGMYGEAAKVLEAMAGDDRGEAGTLLLARSYANMGRLEEASRWCESVKAANSLNKAAYMLLATIMLEQARVEDAIECLKKALYLDQDFVIAHFMLGKLLKAVDGSHDQAMRHFDAAYRLIEAEKDDALLPESDGVMAGRLREILALTLKV